ncbi:hypothetical protein D3C72_1327110 [compost metagenome]
MAEAVGPDLVAHPREVLDRQARYAEMLGHVPLGPGVDLRLVQLGRRQHIAEAGQVAVAVKVGAIGLLAHRLLGIDPARGAVGQPERVSGLPEHRLDRRLGLPDQLLAFLHRHQRGAGRQQHGAQRRHEPARAAGDCGVHGNPRSMHGSDTPSVVRRPDLCAPDAAFGGFFAQDYGFLGETGGATPAHRTFARSRALPYHPALSGRIYEGCGVVAWMAGRVVAGGGGRRVGAGADPAGHDRRAFRPVRQRRRSGGAQPAPGHRAHQRARRRQDRRRRTPAGAGHLRQQGQCRREPDPVPRAH